MEELKVDYEFDLHDFKMMENIEHSYFPNENISPAEEVLRWYEKNAFRDTSQKQLMFLFFKELPVFSKCPQKQVSPKAYNEEVNMAININYKENLNEEFYEIIDIEFNKFATKNGVSCNYKPFNFIAKEDEKVIGIITGHSYYREVHIGDLVVLEKYRNKHIGTKLVAAVENHYKDKGFENMNLTTYDFQAPEFYKKCGFKVEFIRENKKNPKLNKYFLVKYF